MTSSTKPLPIERQSNDGRSSSSSFFWSLLAGVPVFIALAGSSLLYTHFIAGIPDFVILHRMAGGSTAFRCSRCRSSFSPAI